MAKMIPETHSIAIIMAGSAHSVKWRSESFVFIKSKS